MKLKKLFCFAIDVCLCVTSLHAQTPADSLHGGEQTKVGYMQENPSTATSSMVTVDYKQFYKGLVTSATWTALQANHYGKDDEDSRFKSNYWAGEVADNNSEIITDRTGKPLTYMPYEVNIDMTGSPYLETAGARMKKYEIDINATEKGKQMENDIVLFRYADVLLMMAEAKVRNGETGQWEFDLVRSRARMPLRQATLDNIYVERLIELAWEGWRRNDMIRFNRYKSEYNGGNAVDESDHHTIVFPIPANARATNANLKQHPGY